MTDHPGVPLSAAFDAARAVAQLLVDSDADVSDAVSAVVSDIRLRYGDAGVVALIGYLSYFVAESIAGGLTDGVGRHGDRASLLPAVLAGIDAREREVSREMAVRS